MLLWRYCTRKLRKLPDFMILGTEKSGTTSLYNYLIKHPQIAKPRVKEIHFFDKKYGRGFDWYRMFFPLLLTRKMVFEATATYFRDENVPKRIFEMNGLIKFIVLFRDPLERAYSHWNEYHKDGFDKNSFLESGFRNYYLDISRYDLYFEEWFKYFEIFNFLFIKTKDFFHDTRFYYDQICSFLNLKTPKNIKFPTYNYRGSKIPDNVREGLEGYFDKTNESMKSFTGFSW